MVTSRAATISPQPMVNIGSCQSNSAPAAKQHPGADHRRRGEEADDPLALGAGDHQDDQRPRGDAGSGQQQLRRPEPPGHRQRQRGGDRHQRGDRQRRARRVPIAQPISRPVTATSAAITATATQSGQRAGGHPVGDPQTGRQEGHDDRRGQRTALDMRCAPRLAPRCREDHRGVGDVLDDAGRGRTGRAPAATQAGHRRRHRRCPGWRPG